jgi:hypothetical protein
MTSLARALVSMLRSRAALLLENALLRQQIIVLRRAAPHPRFNLGFAPADSLAVEKSPQA